MLQYLYICYNACNYDIYTQKTRGSMPAYCHGETAMVLSILVFFIASALYSFYLLLLITSRDKNRLTRIMSICSILLSIWAAADGIRLLSSGSIAASVLSCLQLVSISYFPAFFLLFILIVSSIRNRMDSSSGIRLMFLPGTIMLILSLLLISLFAINPMQNILFMVLLNSYHVIFYAISTAVLFKWKEKSQYGLDARKARVLILSGIPIALIGCAAYYILPSFGYSNNLITTPVLMILLSFAVICIIPSFKKSVPDWQMASNGVLQNTMDIVVLMDIKGNILKVNNRVYDYLGFSEDELIGKPVEAITSNLKPTELKSICLNDKMNITYEQPFMTINGDTLPFSINITSINNNTGKPGYIVMVAHDMSSIKLLEKEIEERKKNEEKMEYLLLYDTLTGLYNRSFFESEIERLSYDGAYPLAYVLCDVDGLKFINETLGHTYGDQLLVRTAEILSSAAKPNTLISRVGGDEFAMVIQSANRYETVQLVERIHKEIDESNRKEPDNLLSLSIGYDLSYEKSRDFSDVYKEAYDRMSREKLTHIKSSRNSLVKTLMNMLEARDNITEEHTERMQHYSAALCRSMGLAKDTTEEVVLLARFHDIGKVGIPDRLLFKNGKLTSEEKLEMQRHCNIGQKIALSSHELTHISDYILKHHEWWNGGGYPHELKGTQIPIQCRIISIVDAFDAMVNDRPYRKAMPLQEALAELKACAGTQFDPMLLDYFLEINS